MLFYISKIGKLTKSMIVRDRGFETYRKVTEFKFDDIKINFMFFRDTSENIDFF